MQYEKENYYVQNFLIVPKHFFVPEVIEKRRALSQTARRAVWTGCNIILTSIPESGRIFYIKNGRKENEEMIIKKWKKTLFLRKQKKELRGWTLDG